MRLTLKGVLLLSEAEPANTPPLKRCCKPSHRALVAYPSEEFPAGETMGGCIKKLVCGARELV